MGAYVKSLDPNHLVTLGVIGSPQPGVGSGNYERLHGLASIDFLEAHDYGANDESLPGWPLQAVAPIHTGLFSQDQRWIWTHWSHRQNAARTWEEWSSTIPAGTQPFERLGLDFYGPYSGDLYIDRIEIGSRVYDFEEGTAEGWQATDRLTLANSGAIASSGSRSLRLTFGASDGGAQVWLPADPTDGPGTPIRVRVYVDTPGQLLVTDTIAGALHHASTLNKPLLVGEAGMATCGSHGGWQEETLLSRAQKFDRKLGAFFSNGGAGYLIWAWNPESGCATNFTSGDPLNEVLRKHASAVR